MKIAEKIISTYEEKPNLKLMAKSVASMAVSSALDDAEERGINDLSNSEQREFFKLLGKEMTSQFKRMT